GRGERQRGLGVRGGRARGGSPRGVGGSRPKKGAPLGGGGGRVDKRGAARPPASTAHGPADHPAASGSRGPVDRGGSQGRGTTRRRRPRLEGGRCAERGFPRCHRAR